MSTLTTKQRAKANAALCLIHSQGGDPSAVTRLAAQYRSIGNDDRTAMELALSSYADGNPGLLPAMQRVTELIEASDDRTTAAYDQALSAFIQTGDDSALVAMAPTIQADALALAVRSGELTAEEAQEEGAAGFALGFDFGGDGPAGEGGPAPAGAALGGPAAGGPPGSQGGSPAVRVQAPPMRAPAASPAAADPRHEGAFTTSPTGMRGARAQARWDDTPLAGASRPDPYAGMSPAAARAAIRQGIMGGGKAVIGPQADGSA